jgi:hypothetical protein
VFRAADAESGAQSRELNKGNGVLGTDGVRGVRTRRKASRAVRALSASPVSSTPLDRTAPVRSRTSTTPMAFLSF